MPNNPTDKLQQITDKRVALESLIKIACNIENQQKALNEVAQAARPSQDFPKSLLNHYKALQKRMENIEPENLILKLEKVESSLGESVINIISLTKIDVNELRDHQIENLDIDAFQNFINQFKQKTNTSLALRLILKNRNLLIPPFKLPVSQEQIALEIENLKTKERDCVKQIRSEINSIIDDTQQLLQQTGLPQAIIDELNKVKKGMVVNLEHLDKGGSIHEVPNTFEIITLESPPPLPHETVHVQSDNSKEKPSVTKESHDLKTSTKTANNTQANPAQKKTPANSTLQRASQQATSEETPQKSYWWIFKLWLRTPWKTSWTSLVKKYRHK